MLLTGAEIIIETLKKRGVDTIFGYPGGTAITVYDALYRRGSGIRHILTSHEQGAAHAADGYARATGRTGVCLVTSGPGATNLVTGIATAYMDSVPMVALTVNVATGDLGKDSFQEVDISGITMPVTKHSFIVKDITRLAATLERAFDIAASGRPGPVLVDITKDVTKAECEFESTGEGDPAAQTAGKCAAAGQISGMAAAGGQMAGTAGQTPVLTMRAAAQDADEAATEIKKACAIVSKAIRPLLLVGGGAVTSGACTQLRQLAELLNAPVVDTLLGKGVVRGDDPHYLGMAGMYGTHAAAAAFAEADLIIAVGTRFSERVTHNSPDFAPHAAIVQIDIDRAELNKNIRVDVAVAGDAAAVLDELLKLLKKPAKTVAEARVKWLAGLRRIGEETDWRSVMDEDVPARSMAWTGSADTLDTAAGRRDIACTEYADTLDTAAGGHDKACTGCTDTLDTAAGGQDIACTECADIPGMAAGGQDGMSAGLTGPDIVRRISEMSDEDVIITTEVGLNQMWAAGYYTYSRPGQLITSGGLGTMGFGLGAAIGAAVGCPGRRVINFAGDGCFRMNMNELLTAVRLGLPIIEVIFDNRALGMVRKMQDLYYGERHSETDLEDGADYAAIARAMGAQAFDVGDISELETAYRQVAACSGPSLIVCRMR